MSRRTTMLARAVVLVLGAVVCLAATGERPVAAGAQDARPAAAAPPASHADDITRYCVSCHNDRTRTAGLSLERADLSAVAAQPDVWERVARKLRSGMMPPPGMPAPDQPSRHALVSWLEASLDRAAASQPKPGRPLAHRLNRTEYANAIRDLLALEVDVTSLLPADDSTFGFDNIADVLGVSPVLLESYLTAGERISALALGDPSAPPAGEVFRIRQDASQDRHVEGLPLGTVGGLAIQRNVPLDGEYEVRVKLFRTNLGTMRGLEYPQQLEIAVDGERVHLAHFGGDADIAASSENPTTTGDDIDNRFTVRVPLKAGPRTITVAFIEKTHARNTRRLQPYVRSSADTIDFSGFPHIDEVLFSGPFNATGVGDTPSRRRIFICSPARPADEPQCASRIIAALARRAYRGDVTPDDLRLLSDFYERGRADGGSFDSGIELALRRILASPKFVFRVERDPAETAPGSVYVLGDRELASRLSFFLWSSLPDDELLDLAEQGTLGKPDVLDRQVRRMLADARAGALLDNFVGQWLHLRNLGAKLPNSHEFPDFDDNLRRAMRTELELFVGSVLREDRSVLDLMTADYSFLNDRLARHYGVPNIDGSHFRRVTLADPVRHGLLGKGAVLMVTSHPHRTSPVLRGKWVLENVLGSPPPAPPDEVPPFEEDVQAQKPRSVRERLERHRANPACASCHRVIDPVGLALENFDAVGAWRTRDGGTRGSAVDASGELAGGERVNGVVELRRALLREPETFVRTMTEKLLIYALGRGLDATDLPVVRGIVRDAGAHDYRFSAVVLGIVRSVPFRMRVKAEAPIGTQARISPGR